MPLPHFDALTPVEKGWSGDEKYKAVAPDGQSYLLRIAPEGKREIYAAMFRAQQQLAKWDVRMCMPVELGDCDRGVYVVQSWIDGQDAEEVIPALPEEAQYAMGLDAGAMLRKIHRLPAPPDQPDWEMRFNAKMDRKIRMYRDCPVHFEGGDALIAYIEGNRHLLKDRPQTFQHGDYHIGNMMVAQGEVVIIDFDRLDYGDPWEEFNRIVWCAQQAPAFARGMVDGYFDGQPPRLFWQLLALYISSNMLSSVPWALPFGQETVDTMLNQARDVLDWFDHMTQEVPRWYRCPQAPSRPT